mmetsp:Transcript_10515/g.28064  ORF Transcript_10515/g.28064 Transcript_10515/m.28064 type:complete len:265 (+) Transcript_10515:1092-1886(+)
MPMPTSALWIMLQSLAPSPMASVIAFRTRLMRRTTAPFCLGETRQQMTVRHTIAMSTKASSLSGSSANSRHLPSITKPSSICPALWAFLACSAYSCSLLRITCGWKMPSTSNSFVVRIGLSFLSLGPGSSRLVATPMIIAVSILSPVSIQTLMPAATRLAIVSPTLSCNRSSMPVSPCNSRSRSISSATSSRRSCRFWVAQAASLNFASHASSSSLARSRPARQSVRRPSSQKSWRTSRVLLMTGVFFSRGRSLSMITESAPFV